MEPAQGRDAERQYHLWDVLIVSGMAQELVSDRNTPRRLAEGHPQLVPGHLETYLRFLDELPEDAARVERLLVMLNRLVDLQPPKEVVVVGCGPRPRLVQLLADRAYHVVGVEPVPSFVAAAAAFLNSPEVVREGSAEALPLPAASQDLVLCESVLEHVDSPRVALDEMYRVLRPEGIAYITTTNRLKLSLTGDAGEFNVRFFNWLPGGVKESYVFSHLHHDPTLANFSLRPAVHWFTFTELCRLGRDSGFAQFYSPVDLVVTSDPSVSRKWWRRVILRRLQRSPWLRALALTQVGHAIAMLKRADAWPTS